MATNLSLATSAVVSAFFLLNVYVSYIMINARCDCTDTARYLLSGLACKYVMQRASSKLEKNSILPSVVL